MLLCLLLLVSGTHGFIVSKCCGPQQALTTTYKCSDYNATDSWFPSDVNVVSEDHQTPPAFLQSEDYNLTVQYQAHVPCEGRHHLVLAEDADSFAFLTSGDLFLYDNNGVTNMTFPSSSFCFDNFILNSARSVKVLILCPCTNMTCIKKCCPSHRHLDENNRCVSSEEEVRWRPSFSGDTPDHFQLFGLPRCSEGGVYMLNHGSNEPRRFWFLEDGRVVGHGFREPIPLEEYCWDMIRDDLGNRTPNLLYCKKWEGRKSSDRRVFYGVMLLVDAVFLCATLLVYALLPELRVGLHAKYLMAHTASFLVAYLFLGLGQLVPNLGQAFCIVIAFIIQFAFLAAFFWLNVMCIDIAWAFSGLRPPQGSAMERDYKKFLFYSAYAWGATGILSVITAAVEFVPGMISPDSPLKPNIGRRACWFEKHPAIFAYFYGPMAFLLLANLMLFMYTAARIISVRRDTAILNSAGNTSGSAIHKDKQRLILYIKLFCLMGLTWVTEIISWAVGGAEYYWYITDVVNMLRAVFIFVIFCCKRSVLHLLKVRLASFLPCAKSLTRGKSTLSYSGPTSSLRLTTSVKKSVKRPSYDKSVRRPSHEQNARRPSHEQNVRRLSHEQNVRRPSHDQNVRRTSHEQNARSTNHEQGIRRLSFEDDVRRPSFEENVNPEQNVRRLSFDQSVARPVHDLNTRRPSQERSDRRSSYDTNDRRSSEDTSIRRLSLDT